VERASVTRNHRHVEGHQEDKQPPHLLDRWSLLNIEMDQSAKEALTKWSEERANHQEILGEPLTIWVDNTKLGCDIFDQLYHRVHGSEVESYWKGKKGLATEQLQEMNWTAIGKARKKGTLTRKIFITKHVTGMCGVGKFMKLWKERDFDKCS
jgi:hypothetical protein